MKIIKGNQFIKCECGKILAEYKDGWLKIDAQRVKYSSDGTVHKFKCDKCKRILEIKILK